MLMPGITISYLGYPIIAGNAVLGPSYPENPALQTPDPLSITIGVLKFIDIF